MSCEFYQVPGCFCLCFFLKPKKLTFSNFGNLRKKKQEDGEEYDCPMELGQASGGTSKKGFKPGLDVRLYDEDDLDRLEQVNMTPLACFKVFSLFENFVCSLLTKDVFFKYLIIKIIVY